ncbi:MAG TPA: histidine kinase [Yinghuangia sp.]|uniref:sensor histidine kinase n=1 Tax=Yinghuangia sp. YIM S10712 TaxID=3436930 RepID=UPI002B941BAD|nr:histidine kinase [Yinghuangia sp.]
MFARLRRRLRGKPLLTECLLWVTTTLAALSVNRPEPFFTGKLGAHLGVVAVAGAVSVRFPAVAAAIGVGLAQRDGRYYALVALVAFLCGLRTGSMRQLAGAPALTVPAVFVAGVGTDLRPVSALVAELVASAVVPWLLGRNWRQRRELAAAGWDRARHLEREREMLGEQARSRERARIAQDMHDSLGHDLSLLALRAAALEVDPGLGETQRTKAAELRVGAAEASDRLHEIIGVLRSDTDRAPTDPVHEPLDVLVARSRASGLTVELTETGASEPVSGAVALAVHRVVREALTNAAKHAPGARVTVSVAHTGRSTNVSVTNGPPSADAVPGPAGRANAIAPGSRSGLISLRERVRLAGGTFAAGPRGGGFTVTAHFPHPAAAPLSPGEKLAS